MGASAGPTAQRRGDTAEAVTGYRSSFGNWDRRASVRVKPRRVLTPDDAGQIYFPPELVPAVAHPLVAGRGPDAVRRLLVWRLFQYLNFTTELETVAVMPVTAEISLGRSGIDLPPEMRHDAFKITTDEAWHAQFSHDLMCQVSQQTQVPIRLPQEPQFLQRLSAIRSDLDSDLLGATPLAFAIISETLISTILSDLPRDHRLPPPVRELVADHAEDEGKHHAYFRAVLRAFWPALGRAEQRRLGPWLPTLIDAFLEPDYRGTSYALFDLGLTDEEVAQILAESYPATRIRGEIAEAAQATVRYLEDVGALDDDETRDAFIRHALIVA